ncbi:MAG: hypothetical protein JWN49_287 [Parcubacteria group bacterium]|nr:hypothetical protein [Parcubacteria group bacterium]
MSMFPYYPALGVGIVIDHLYLYMVCFEGLRCPHPRAFLFIDN